MRNLAISITSAIMLLALATACSRRPSDETIAKDIQTKAAADPDTRDSEVSVAAKDGKVTLTGKVKTPVAQQKLEQIAHEEPGANAVDDQTTVESPAAVAAPTPVPAAPTRASARGETQATAGCDTGRHGSYSQNGGLPEFKAEPSWTNFQRDAGATGKCWRKDNAACGMQSQRRRGDSQSQGQDQGRRPA